MSRKLKLLILGIAVLASFIISLSVYLVKENGTNQYLIFYPAYTEGENDVIEKKEVPNLDTKEKDIYQFIVYYSFGPSTSTGKHLEARVFYPEDIKPSSVVLRKKILYIDFPYEFAIEIAESDYELKSSLGYIEKNIKYNFSRINSIVFMVGGRVVTFPEDEATVSDDDEVNEASESVPVVN
ncbi:MAG: hypothetical protein JXR63_05935 [Spirochaetales bacterium]|nr:hypothetical protein [Spirochaetales bacterium]